MLSEIVIYRDPDTGRWSTTLIDEDGVVDTFWSASEEECKRRVWWIMIAYNTPFIISEDQE